MTWHAQVIQYSGREDWLEKRRSGLGSSDVAGILGLSPWSTPFTVWAAKRHGAEKESTEAMDIGKRAEDLVASIFEDRSGLYVGARELLLHNPQHEWAMATIDALAFESPVNLDELFDQGDTYYEDALGIVEFKMEGGFGAWSEVPTHYQIQVQHQLLVTGLEHAWLPVLHNGRHFEVYELEADKRVHDLIIEKVGEFRETYLLDPDAPPPEVDEHPATARVIADLWSDPSGEEIDLSHENYADVEAWRAARVRLAEAKAEVDRLKNRLAVALQEAVVGSWQGMPVISFKKQTRKEHMVRESSFRMLREVGSKED